MHLNWTNIKVEPLSLSFNEFGHPQYHRCVWCNADAEFSVSRTSVMTSTPHNDFACGEHARNWVVSEKPLQK